MVASIASAKTSSKEGWGQELWLAHHLDLLEEPQETPSTAPLMSGG